jgi:hypothetical protein
MPAKKGQAGLKWSNNSRRFIKLLFLKFYGGYVPQRGMTTSAVIKYLGGIGDILPGSRSAEIPRPQNLLNFETAEETLRHSISQQSPFLFMLDSIPWFNAR